MRIPEPQRFNAARLQKRRALGIVILRVATHQAGLASAKDVC
jgi:hypothetical protein